LFVLTTFENAEGGLDVIGTFIFRNIFVKRSKGGFHALLQPVNLEQENKWSILLLNDIISFDVSDS
jgi:hypothetical protein